MELHPEFQFSKFRTINFRENDRKPSLTFIDEAHIYLKAKSPVPQNSIGTSRDFGLIHSRPQLGAEPTKWLRLLPDFGPDKNGGSESCELVKPHQPLQNDILSLSHSLAALAASMMDIEWKNKIVSAIALACWDKLQELPGDAVHGRHRTGELTASYNMYRLWIRSAVEHKFSVWWNKGAETQRDFGGGVNSWMVRTAW